MYKKRGLLNSLRLVFAKKLLEYMKQCYVVLRKTSQRDEECIASEESICYTLFSMGITLKCTEYTYTLCVVVFYFMNK
jgi:hypothetical protein